MRTEQLFYFESLGDLYIRKPYANLIVTSPPYPMVKMWDDMFNKTIGKTGPKLMHTQMCYSLNHIWRVCQRILKPGGFLCINIGDAVRKFATFQLFNNHAYIIEAMRKYDLKQLPSIIWRKPTNAPNKFMGSGTLPLKAYVTLEHEHILIFQKEGVRELSKKEEILRRRSSIFWKERNVWYSDIWNFTGAKQEKDGIRTAAFPLELPHRLINMYSIQGDLVIDPFLGSGTTMLAAAINFRNFAGFEINRKLEPIIHQTMSNVKETNRKIVKKRIIENKIEGKYQSKYGPVKTKQEININLPIVESCNRNGNTYTCIGN